MDGFLDRLFNTATGVFEKVADFELGKLELELATQYKLLGLAANQDAAPQPAGSSVLNFDFGTIPWVPIGVAVGGGVLAWFVIKKFA